MNYDYWLARYPVTVAQWKQFCAEAKHAPRDDDSLRDPTNHPVRYVTWHEALKFCDWLNTKIDLSGLKDRTGLTYKFTLPSEAEWEKAARGGLQIPRSPAGFISAKDLEGLQDLRGLDLMDNPASACLPVGHRCRPKPCQLR